MFNPTIIKPNKNASKPCTRTRKNALKNKKNKKKHIYIEKPVSWIKRA